MLILDHGNSLVYSSIPVLGSCPGLICLETTCTRGHFCLDVPFLVMMKKEGFMLLTLPSHSHEWCSIHSW